MTRALPVLVLCALGGCAQLPPDAFVLTPELLKQRQVETRRYGGIEERELLVACSNVLQDLGFTLENSEVKLGVLTANKQRDATDGREVALAIAVALLGGGQMPISKDQTIRVSLVVRPVTTSAGTPSADEHFVRVTFQRIVRRSDNSTVAQAVGDEGLYEQFFEKVSKAVFIEAQKL